MSESSPETETEAESQDHGDDHGDQPAPEENSGGSGDAGDTDDSEVGISDDQLPEDLQPTDDNPLAKPPDDDDEDAGMSLGPDGPGAEGAPPG